MLKLLWRQIYLIILVIDFFFQLNDNNILHSVIFFSKNLHFAEYNDEIYEKKIITYYQIF